MGGRAGAQTPPRDKPEMRENCPGLVASDAPRLMQATLQLALNSDQARVTYSGHSTFLIESPQLVRIATDYNDYVRPPLLPDIATMNHAHSTHFTTIPIRASRICCAAGVRARTSPPAMTFRFVTCGCATFRPTSATGAAVPNGMAIRSSFLKPRTCASPISAICITR